MLMDFLTEPAQSTVLIMLPLLLLLSAWIIFRLLLREVYCWYYKINKTVVNAGLFLTESPVEN